MRSVVRNTKVVWGLLVLLCLAPLGLAAAADNQPGPHMALAINDSNVTKNGIRVRLTETAIRYLRITIRDLLASYDSKGGSGMNLLLDPGYDPASHSAGPVRTTPVESKWAWSGGNYQWIQNRKWGDPGTLCNNDNTVGGNQRGVPAALQNLNREQGFYVLTTDGQCHDQFNFCNYSYGGNPIWIYTPHVGYDPAAACTLDPINVIGDPDSGNYAQIFLNIGLFIFPTMYMENQPDPIDGYNPSDLGAYTGAGGAPGVTTRSQNGWTAATPPPQGSYVPGNAYSMDTGTYFRSGDDAAMYLNYNQMQIQSVNRASFRPSECGVDLVYSGQHDANHEPVYYGATVPQCLRAKSYWKGESNVRPKTLNAAKNEVPHWEPCDPYDTYLFDGVTLNPERDDDEGLYPGAPNDGSGPVCGAGIDQWTAGSAGWYGLEMKSFTIVPDTAGADKNTIILNLSAPELRLEYGLWVDAWAHGEVVWIPLSISFTRLWTVGYAASTRIDATAKVKLESIDDQSCSPGSQACSGFFHPYNDGKVLPDKFLINIMMNPATDFHLEPLTFYGPSLCIIDFGALGCLLNFGDVLNLVKGMITDVVAEQLGPVILDLLSDITGIVPNLTSILGDPWNFGTGLIEYGLFFTGDQNQNDGGNPPKWPVKFFDGPNGGAGTDKVGDIRMAVGFKPIAFRPADPSNSNIMRVDPNDPPCKANDPRVGCTSLPNPSLASVYGVPKLVEPDTSTCVQASTGSYAAGLAGYRKRALGTYTYSQSTGRIVFSFSGGYTGTDVRVGDVVWDVTKNQGLPLQMLDAGGGAGNVGPGQNSILDGGSFEIREGTVLGISGMTAAQMGAIAPTMTFLDTSTGKRGVITEVVGAGTPATAKIFLSEDYNAANFDGGAFKILNCSAANTFPTPDDDGQYDAAATVVAGTFNDTKGGVSYSASQVIREYWQGPIEKFKGPPSWCVTPNSLRTGATGADFDFLYPQKTWLSFHNTADKNLLGQSVPRNTYGGWDKMDANTVLKQNTNSGVKDAAQIPYDLSIHIHQRTFASLMQALVASGITCLEFSTVDTDGSSTPWAGMLNVGAFNAFLPGIASLFPSAMTVSVRISPEVTPHLRTGVGRLSFMPRERLKDPAGGPLPINNERYTFGIALPDLKIEVVAMDTVPVTLMTMYWSTTFGFYTKAVRACYKLDPLKNAVDCTSTEVNKRTVAGYSEFFADLNSDSLAREFENGRDGLAVGQFSNRDIGTARGESSFVVAQSVCDMLPGRCNMLGLSQAIPMLLNSLVQMFFVTRLSVYNFTIDTLYMGPDGPNDDLIGGGDYIGVYARLLGGLDIFALLNGATGGQGLALAPEFEAQFQPMATLPGLAQETYINTNAPIFDVALQASAALPDGVQSYSYAIDDGFWHTPVDNPKLELSGLLEGQHKLALKAYTDTFDGAYRQVAPTVLKFTVDTLPPEVTIYPSERGFFTHRVRFSATDFQASPEQMSYSYSFDDGKWVDADDTMSISLSGVKPGRHTLRVKATDLAGNDGIAARVLVVDDAGCGGCASSGPGDITWLVVALSILAIRFGRRRTA